MNVGNFSNFPRSFMILYRVATRDNWTDIYEFILNKYSTDEKWKVQTFFITFMVFVSLVMINLYIAVILEQFSEGLPLPKTSFTTFRFFEFFF